MLAQPRCHVDLCQAVDGVGEANIPSVDHHMMLYLPGLTSTSGGIPPGCAAQHAIDRLKLEAGARGLRAMVYRRISEIKISITELVTWADLHPAALGPRNAKTNSTVRPTLGENVAILHQ